MAIVLLAFVLPLVSSIPRISLQNPPLMVPLSTIPSPLTAALIQKPPTTKAPIPLVILCRNDSCRSGSRDFLCTRGNINVIPKIGLTLLLYAEQIGFNGIDVQYYATMPSSFLKEGILRSVTWRSFESKRASWITCAPKPIPIVGDPFVSSETGWCCPPCSWLSPQSSPPTLLCCGHC